ncbi:4Fe-4S ferredoxin iron-sulfur binding domain protein [Chloroherpeton thalassium ATCC 35110]|uniref:4Fe-4S ferredoxin iron-sulfur binding domain protein n=1 Tax=Chloroherpeton thalassium (strain ATCC 35110 / GB-78) TaxID=517418 RepID=B3QSV0_CHLT3|nr:4Fe-4S dicluster domain-containing protein [Chloroherpeton thalassium]ACF12593.1 4Fe-4S ferredoxin iron-sulfur binding domain protein [Chloroherpeton thalassium ATCC 35110]
MNYSFVIDNRKCIGCHACSTACKSENSVPLGVSRTWVKYTEQGAYPNTKRYFQVTRCNHCANPPCVRICPVTAMYQREDGIVEFDKNVCIGCKACTQACPYNAIHVDPDSGTASKCHFCAHRLENGLEPACVVVCPQHAIVCGDLDDPNSEIQKVLSKNSVTVRKPEQGTAPKLFYIEGHDLNLTPTAAEHLSKEFLWAETPAAYRNGHAKKSASTNGTKRKSTSGTAIRRLAAQGHPNGGTVQTGEREASQMAQVAYDIRHALQWHWPVPAYLVTKGVAAGLILFLAVVHAFGLAKIGGTLAAVGFFTSLIFSALTSVFLVVDLEKPDRFLRVMFRPQTKSWLARGAVYLGLFSTLSAVWWGSEMLSLMGVIGEISPELRTAALVAMIPFSLGVTVYTAFLFGQAEGRDLWQSPLLPLHLIVQAVMAGAGTLLILNLFAPLAPEVFSLAKNGFLIFLTLDLLVIFFGEIAMPHASETAAAAAHKMIHGEFKSYFWGGAIAVGHLAAFLLVLTNVGIGMALGGVAMLVGLYFYEYAFVTAPQKVANS